MADDPHQYSLSEFATQFTWALLFWNAAERTLRQIVAELIGSSTAAALAVAMDMGTRGVLSALEASRRQITDADELCDHLAHLSVGFSILIGHRNHYVHGLSGVSWKDKEPRDSIIHLDGFIITLKGEGRLRSTMRQIAFKEMLEFKQHCLDLSQYARAVMNELVEDEWELEGLLDTDPPSLQKPIWPKSLQNTPSYLQA
ncbi:MAG: hypothetical protein ABL914_03140 [Novosphingobium sp.]|uniref:hypothetical protein n=1 Tax=Novosphingobium sp. TaxID=1874826 RepID=UPI0032B98E81